MGCECDERCLPAVTPTSGFATLVLLVAAVYVGGGTLYRKHGVLPSH